MNERAHERAYLVAVGLSAAALAAVLWVWGLPLGNDGATHVFQAYVRNHFDDPARRYADYYELLRPITGMGFGDMQRALEPWLGWQTAWRVNVIVCAELWAFGYLYFAHRLAPSRRMLGLLGFAMPLQVALWLGLIPFLLACALGWFVLGLALRPLGAKQLVALAVLLTLMARAHVFPAALVGVTLVPLVLAQTPRAGWPRSLVVLAACGAPALVLTWLSRDTAGSLGFSGAVEPFVDRLLFVGARFQSGPVWRKAFATLLVALALWSVWRRSRGGGLSAPERALVGMGALWLVVSAMAPVDVGDWQLGGIRALPLAAGVLLAFLPIDQAKWRAAMGGAVAAYLVTTFVWAAATHRALRDATAPALAGLTLPVNGLDRVALVTVDPVPAELAPSMRFAPLIHIGNLYSLARGGVDPYGHHGQPAAHRLRLKPGWRELAPPVDTWPPLWNLEGELRAGAIRSALSRLTGFHELVLFGRTADVELALAAGWQPSFARDGLLVGTYQGCDARIELRGVDTALEIRLGWWPSRTPTRELSYRPGAGAPTSLVVEGFGCGEVWLDASRPDGARCAEAQPGLPVRASFTRDGANVLACTLTTPTSTPSPSTPAPQTSPPPPASAPLTGP